MTDKPTATARSAGQDHIPTTAALPFTCCEHCGCGTPGGYWPKREGHDDTCRHGCNDSELLAPEIAAVNRSAVAGITSEPRTVGAT